MTVQLNIFFDCQEKMLKLFYRDISFSDTVYQVKDRFYGVIRVL